jgi:hypothetical protein
MQDAPLETLSNTILAEIHGGEMSRLTIEPDVIEIISAIEKDSLLVLDERSKSVRMDSCLFVPETEDTPLHDGDDIVFVLIILIIVLGVTPIILLVGLLCILQARITAIILLREFRVTCVVL